MMGEKVFDDGGEAFPGDGYKPGMSLRDWFASRASGFDTETAIDVAAATLGWKVPDYMVMKEFDLKRWWVKADAAYKYLQADAMLEARKRRADSEGEK